MSKSQVKPSHRRNGEKPSPQTILNAVRTHFGVSKKALVEGVPHQGNKPIIHRHVAVRLLREDARLRQDDIAEVMNRSRTTIIRSLRDSEGRFTKEINAVRRLVWLKFPKNNKGS
jgi:hypothetical protein